MFLFPGIDTQQQEVLRDQPTASAPSTMSAIHRVFVADGLYVISLLFFLDLVLVAVRRHFGHMQSYDFIRWNLFLATVPYGVSLCAAMLYRTIPQRGRPIWLYRLLLLPLYALWLLFLPNAPYLLTDFTHLEHKTHLQVLYDTGMLGMYAVTGYALAVISLSIMQRPIRAGFGRRAGWLLVIVCCFLAGIGVHLGRAQRYNSWQLFSQSKAVLGEILDRLLHLYDHPHTMSDGLYYGTLLLIGYTIFLVVGSKEARADLLMWDKSKQH